MPQHESPPAGTPVGREPSSAETTAARPEGSEIFATVRRVQAGDAEAFGTLFRLFAKPLKQFFRNRRLSDAVVDELVQETFLKAWEQIGQYRFDGPFDAWLRRIGENQWKNHWRARQTQKRNMALLPLDPDPDSDAGRAEQPLFGDPPPSPEERAVQADRLRRTRDALDRLAPGQRRCLALRYGQELKYREVAQVLGVSTGAVQSQVHEGTRRLRLLLETGDGGGEDGG